MPRYVIKTSATYYVEADGPEEARAMLQNSSMNLTSYRQNAEKVWEHVTYPADEITSSISRDYAPDPNAPLPF